MSVEIESSSVDGTPSTGKTGMSKVRAFLYGNWYGMLACWCTTGLVALVAIALVGVDRRLTLLADSAHAFQVSVMTPLALSAPIVSAVRRRWGRLCGQVCLGLLAAVLYVLGFCIVSVLAALVPQTS